MVPNRLRKVISQKSSHKISYLTDPVPPQDRNYTFSRIKHYTTKPKPPVSRNENTVLIKMTVSTLASGHACMILDVLARCQHDTQICTRY